MVWPSTASATCSTIQIITVPIQAADRQYETLVVTADEDAVSEVTRSCVAMAARADRHAIK